MRKPAYRVTSDNLEEDFTGDYARAEAMGTFERYKAENKNVTLTSGYIDSVTEEYTATQFLDRYVKE